ncbi:PH domain-containing protein [Methanobrevibacter sp.]|uniref:PH domain-containing protein n=1 Tax=Methanobrevibacter sp. TaxID=66852 RepID=UPI00388ED7FD
MLFNKNDERTNERVLYKTKPNMFLGCKKAIFGVVLLAVVFMVSPMVIQFIGRLQVYLISQIKLPLTRFAAIAFFVVILIIILYIIWQLLKWYSLEYTLTDSRIIIKSGLLSTKKNYMPYTTIQDINTSQSIFARMFNVGTVSVFSAYDNNLMSIENVSDPSKVEDIIFSNMMNHRSFQDTPQSYIERDMGRGFQDNSRNYTERDMGRGFQDTRSYSERDTGRSYSENSYNDDYYDEFEPITPIAHERSSRPRREYEYYPEDFGYRDDNVKRYEYEPYEDELEYTMDRAVNNSSESIRYEGGPNSFSNDSHYNDSRDNYSNSHEDYYQNDEPRIQYNESHENNYQDEPSHVAEKEDSSETVIRRHFDKFKK